jgi:hypothetical protein
MADTVKVYPMGANASEKIKDAHHSHAVRIKGGVMEPVCRVKLKHLCLDDSQCEDAPTCPSCLRAIKRSNLIVIK